MQRVYRYKGPFSSQQKPGREPRSCFVLADVQKQLQYMLEREGTWDEVEKVKARIQQDIAPELLTDIVDGVFYQNLCQPGGFLHSSTSLVLCSILMVFLYTVHQM